MPHSPRHERFTLWFPVKVNPSGDLEGVAVSRNVSQTGVLMATAETLEVGQPIRVTFQLDLLGDEERTVDGIIVRSEANESDPDGLWPHRVAVAFDPPLPELEPVLRRLAKEQT